MTSIELGLQDEIERFFGIQKREINEFEPLEGSNHVYSFVVKKEKYVIHKLIDTSIMNPEHEKAAYNALKQIKNPLKDGVLKISPWNLCVCGGTNPPHPQFSALKGGE